MLEQHDSRPMPREVETSENNIVAPLYVND
jgi:hypothetical protein